MATPILNTTKPVDSKVPKVTVITDAKPGTYRVRLVVTDEAGLQSAPVEQTIVVRQGTTGPNAMTDGGTPAPRQPRTPRRPSG